ncbi:unnamed protein product, partial [Staurois parvus]
EKSRCGSASGDVTTILVHAVWNVFPQLPICWTRRSFVMNLNCSDASTLKKLLTQILQQLEQANSTSPPASEDRENDDAYLYILLIMIFYGCLAGGLILAYTRSRKQESKNDPYHLYIEREWGKHGKHGLPAEENLHRGSIESENLL